MCSKFRTFPAPTRVMSENRSDTFWTAVRTVTKGEGCQSWQWQSGYDIKRLRSKHKAYSYQRRHGQKGARIRFWKQHDNNNNSNHWTTFYRNHWTITANPLPWVVFNPLSVQYRLVWADRYSIQGLRRRKEHTKSVHLIYFNFHHLYWKWLPM